MKTPLPGIVKDMRVLLTIIDLSSILPGRAILMERLTSFRIADKIKMVNSR